MAVATQKKQDRKAVKDNASQQNDNKQRGAVEIMGKQVDDATCCGNDHIDRDESPRIENNTGQ